MNNLTEDPEFIRLVVAEWVEAPHDRDALSAAAQIVDEGGGPALFDALRKHVGLDGEGVELVHRIMLLLEAAMDVQPRLGGYLMLKLYPLAGRKGAHEVYNAIELWMDASDSMAVADVLMKQSEEVGPSRRRRYQEWAERIRKRTPNPEGSRGGA